MRESPRRAAITICDVSVCVGAPPDAADCAAIVTVADVVPVTALNVVSAVTGVVFRVAIEIIVSVDDVVTSPAGVQPQPPPPHAAPIATPTPNEMAPAAITAPVDGG